MTYPRSSNTRDTMHAPRSGGVAVRERGGSPHVLDLTPTPQVGDRRPKKLPSRWRRMLDERIHLRDLRVRSVSVRARGWRDFPPASAGNLRQAAWITLVRFFEGHPLAELTIFSLLQTVVVLAWRLAIRPAELLILRAIRGREAGARTIAAPTLLPELPSPVEAPEVMEVREAFRLPKPAMPRLALAYAPQLGWQRGVAGFAAVALVLVLPLSAYSSIGSLTATKDAAVSRSVDALAALKAAGGAVSSNDFSAASDAFASAERDFESAKQELGTLAALLSAAGTLAPSHPFSSAGNLLTAGEEIAKGGERVAAGLAALDQDLTPAERIRRLGTDLSAALPHLDRAALAIEKTSVRGVPGDYRASVITAKQEFPALVAGLREATEVAGFLAVMLGADEPRRYLIVFQNDTELRPTGGFIGSFALLDLDDGKVKHIEIPGGGSYDLKGSLRAKLISPQPLHLINAHWQFQDANWSPDFPTSAERLSWFYEKSGGPTVDGVIAVNADVMSALLGVVGSVEMEGYDVTVDQENFVIATQKEVEIDYDREENRPKQFIADLAPKVLERIFSADRASFLSLVGVLDDALSTKDVQMWFRDEKLQERASAFGWTGETKIAGGDYLQIVHTNIAGQKTDGVMDESITHEAKVLPDGETIVTLSIVRTHTGVKGEPFTGVRNVDFLRVYTPLGSSLVEARGFTPPDPKLFKFPEVGYTNDPGIADLESAAKTDKASGTRITTDLGKTVFGNWVQTDPGETSVVTLVYRLPPGTVVRKAKEEGLLPMIYGEEGGTRMTYSLLVQKQSGARPASFTSRVDFPRGFHATWSANERVAGERGGLEHSMTLDRDAFFGIVAESP